MANRGMTSAMQTEIANKNIKPFHMVSFGFSTPEYYNSTPYDLVNPVDSNTYLGNGSMVKVGPVRESLKIGASGVDIKMAGALLANHTTALSENYINETVTVYGGLLDSNNAVIADPFIMFQGIIDRPIFSENVETGKSEVTWKCKSDFADFERANPFILSDEEQQRRFPNDLGLEFLLLMKLRSGEFSN